MKIECMYINLYSDCQHIYDESSNSYFVWREEKITFLFWIKIKWIKCVSSDFSIKNVKNSYLHRKYDEEKSAHLKNVIGHLNLRSCHPQLILSKQSCGLRSPTTLCGCVIYFICAGRINSSVYYLKVHGKTKLLKLIFEKLVNRSGESMIHFYIHNSNFYDA